MNLRKNKDKKFKDIINSLEIDETYTQIKKRPKHYNKFIDSIVPIEHYNYMSDLIELPKSKQGFKYLLVVMDLATNKFDIEPMKNKDDETTLKAFKTLLKRKILILPEISLKTDNGTEFKGEFHKFLKEKEIFHKYSMPYRKTQMAPVESLNSSIGRILMNYLNKKTMELNDKNIDETYTNWTDILPEIRKDLNKYRERDLKELIKYQEELNFNPYESKTPKYKIGDVVHYQLDKPQTIKGEKLDTKFRHGDRRFSIDSRKIINILQYPNQPYYRYKLFEMPHVSFTDSQLIPSTKEDNYLSVKKIIGKKTENKKLYYLVWFKGELKKQALYLSKDNLIEDGFEDEIKEFEKENRKKKKK
jgi:hypothetical protein